MKSMLSMVGLLMLPFPGIAAQSASEAEPAVITSPAAMPRAPAAPATGSKPAGMPAAASPVSTPVQATAPSTTRSATSPAAAAASATGPGTMGSRDSADRIDLGATQITGNSELPRVMYVVPWKRTELGDLAGRPAKSLLDEVLAPVDRDVFRRQNRYYEALQPDTVATAPEGEK